MIRYVEGIEDGAIDRFCKLNPLSSINEVALDGDVNHRKHPITTLDTRWPTTPMM